MKYLISYLVLLLQFSLSAQNVDIPDPNFKTALISAGVDTNGDGEIQVSEAEVVEILAVGVSNISSLEGISAFKNLKRLACGNNNLTNLDLSKNVKLEKLWCHSNQLNNLNITGCSNLQTFECYNNNIESLFLSSNSSLEFFNIKGNVLLKKIELINLPELASFEYPHNLKVLKVENCPTFNQLELRFIDTLHLTNLKLIENVVITFSDTKELKLNELPNLKHLDCSDNDHLINLSISKCPKLTYLKCEDNDVLHRLDLTEIPSLIYLDCNSNSLLNLDISNCPFLEYLDCRRNHISELNIDSNIYLKTLDISYNTQLRISELKNLISLEHFTCDGLELITELTIFNCTALLTFHCGYNPVLKIINIHQCPKLKEVYVYNGGLVDLSLVDLNSLQKLECQSFELSQLDLTELTELIHLDCSHSNLSQLDLSNNNKLRHLDCSYNNIISINISNLSLLEFLNCSSNKLNEIDLTDLSNLKKLDCSFNSIIELPIHLYDLSNLEELNCSYNDIFKLDVNSLKKLVILDCADNLLEILNISNCPDLFNLDCKRNKIVFLNLKNGTRTPALEIFNHELEYICCDELEYDDITQRIQGMPVSTNPIFGNLCSNFLGLEFNRIHGHNYISSNGVDCSDQKRLKSSVQYNVKLIGENVFGSARSVGLVEFSIKVPPLPIVIEPVLINNYFSSSPDSVYVDFPDIPSPFNTDWCFVPNAEIDDLSIVIMPTSDARPGFETSYRIVYTNKGTTTLSGEVTLQFKNDVTTFQNAIPEPDVVNNNLLVWNYEDLQPFESRDISINFVNNTPMDNPPLNGGEELKFLAQVYPKDNDATTRDNEFLLCQEVVNSFDPNDKTCLEGETILEEMIGEFVHYLIRFENTGTASAINVIVKDEIDTRKFDLSTLDIVDSSHEMDVRINQYNEVEFIFENINLPFQDDLNDGHILFKIKTLPTLTLGDSFENTAEIFFDFNFPIITNTTNTEVVLPTHTSDLENENLSVKVFPNPADNFINIESTNTIYNIDIIDINGRLINRHTRIGNQKLVNINLDNLSHGIYIVSVQTKEGTKMVKVAVE